VTDAAAARILFVTRGRGRGHALPDLAIVEQLAGLAPALVVQFVSYGTGARTLAEAGQPVIDLELEDDAPYLDVLVKLTRVMARERSDVVVSHEEFAALPAARAFELPAALIVDFFPEPRFWKESLRFADEVMFIEHRGIFPEPAELRGKVRYLGPVVRRLTMARADAAAARQRLELPATARVVSVIPGAWATEARAPILGLVMAAFDRLPFPERRLVWVAGSDCDEFGRRLAGRQDVLVRRQHAPIEELMVASDVVITKANRGTTIDLARLGVPSVSLSHGQNPVDEAIIPRLHTNVALNCAGIDARFLAEVLEAIIASAHAGDPAITAIPEYGRHGAEAVARRIRRFVTTAAQRRRCGSGYTGAAAGGGSTRADSSVVK
jgi:hypothetical protein